MRSTTYHLCPHTHPHYLHPLCGSLLASSTRHRRGFRSALSSYADCGRHTFFKVWDYSLKRRLHHDVFFTIHIVYNLEPKVLTICFSTVILSFLPPNYGSCTCTWQCGYEQISFSFSCHVPFTTFKVFMGVLL